MSKITNDGLTRSEP